MPLFKNIEFFNNVNPFLQWAIFIVALLIAIVALFSTGVSIWLSVKYVTYNRRQNSAGMNGEEAARKILDDNDLKHIKVSVTGSLLFGNSYSHYFKKVRLRRLTVKKPSVSSLAMGAQKASLAILDKENDPDMQKRIKLTPIIFFGPMLFVPIVLVGLFIDILLFNFSGITTIVASAAGIAFYLLSFILSIKVLKTEVKAQNKALEILDKENLATVEEQQMMKELFKLYNIQYINDLIMQLLELILRVLMMIANAQSSSSTSSNE